MTFMPSTRRWNQGCYAPQHAAQHTSGLVAWARRRVSGSPRADDLGDAVVTQGP